MDILFNSFYKTIHLVTYGPWEGSGPTVENIVTCSAPMTRAEARAAYEKSDPLDGSEEGYTPEWALTQPWEVLYLKNEEDA